MEITPITPVHNTLRDASNDAAYIQWLDKIENCHYPGGLTIKYAYLCESRCFVVSNSFEDWLIRDTIFSTPCELRFNDNELSFFIYEFDFETLYEKPSFLQVSKSFINRPKLTYRRSIDGWKKLSIPKYYIHRGYRLLYNYLCDFEDYGLKNYLLFLFVKVQYLMQKNVYNLQIKVELDTIKYLLIIFKKKYPNEINNIEFIYNRFVKFLNSKIRKINSMIDIKFILNYYDEILQLIYTINPEDHVYIPAFNVEGELMREAFKLNVKVPRPLLQKYILRHYVYNCTHDILSVPPIKNNFDAKPANSTDVVLGQMYNTEIHCEICTNNVFISQTVFNLNCPHAICYKCYTKIITTSQNCCMCRTTLKPIILIKKGECFNFIIIG